MWPAWYNRLKFPCKGDAYIQDRTAKGSSVTVIHFSSITYTPCYYGGGKYDAVCLKKEH